MAKRSTIEQTYLKYRSHLARVIGGIVKFDDVEDLVQETFVKSYEANLKHEVKYERTYMLQTAKNLALNHVSSAAQRRNQSLDELKDIPRELTSGSLEQDVETKQRFIQFCRATDTLSEQVKRVFLLKKVYGMKQKDIALYLGLSESTVEKHVAKGLFQCSMYLNQANQDDIVNDDEKAKQVISRLTAGITRAKLK